MTDLSFIVIVVVPGVLFLTFIRFLDIVLILELGGVDVVLRLLVVIGKVILVSIILHIVRQVAPLGQGVNRFGIAVEVVR